MKRLGSIICAHSTCLFDNLRNYLTDSIDIVLHVVKLTSVEIENAMNAAINLVQTEPRWIQVVENQVSSMRFGVVQIVVHDSRVVQIERTVKVRLDRVDDNGLQAVQGEAATKSARPA